MIIFFIFPLFGAPYHFRVCAKMVWGRSISTADTKKPPISRRFLGGAALT